MLRSFEIKEKGFKAYINKHIHEFENVYTFKKERIKSWFITYWDSESTLFSFHDNLKEASEAFAIILKTIKNLG